MNKNKTLFIQQCAMFIALLAVSAQIVVPAGGVPFTLQTAVIVIIALTSSLTVTSTSIGIYLLMGFVGMPVFANATGGPAVLQSLSGGFLIGFLIMGSLLSVIKFKRIEFNILLGLGFTIGVYVCGVLSAMIFHKWNLSTSWTFLVKPFIVFDLVKLVIGAIIAERINHLNIFKTNYNKIEFMRITKK